MLGGLWKNLTLAAANTLCKSLIVPAVTNAIQIALNAYNVERPELCQCLTAEVTLLSCATQILNWNTWRQACPKFAKTEMHY